MQGKGGRQAVSSYKFSSVGARFKKQLAELMSALHTMEPHYIRCIKPNSKNRPMDFENTNVLHQLRCGGVLEAVSKENHACSTLEPFMGWLPCKVDSTFCRSIAIPLRAR